jgi:hypothetical protein
MRLNVALCVCLFASLCVPLVCVVLKEPTIASRNKRTQRTQRRSSSSSWSGIDKLGGGGRQPRTKTGEPIWRTKVRS